MGKRYFNAVLDKWQYDSSDDEDCSFYSDQYAVGPPPTGGRGTVIVTGPTTYFNTTTGNFALPSGGVTLPGYVDGTKTYNSTYVTGVPSGGYASLIPPVRNPPDANNVSLTLLPAHATVPNVGTNYFSGFINSSGKNPFGDGFPVYLLGSASTGATCSLNIPVTVPTSTIVLTVLYLYRLSGSADPTFTGGVTLVNTAIDGALMRYSVTIPYTSSAPGTNVQFNCGFTTPSGTSFAYMAHIVPMDVDLAFTLKRPPGSMTLHTYSSIFGGYAYWQSLGVAASYVGLNIVGGTTSNFTYALEATYNYGWKICWPCDFTYSGASADYTTGAGVVYRVPTGTCCFQCPSTPGLNDVTFVVQTPSTKNSFCFGYVIATKAV